MFINSMNDQPAFPQERTLPCGSHEECEGLSMRDYFAAKAMQGLLSSIKKGDNIDVVPELAYIMADAMLAWRNK